MPAGPDPGPAAAVLAQPRVTELPAVNPAARAFFQSTGVCYVAFDTETTNLQYATDGVITIAAKELGTEASFCQLVDPQRDIDPAAKAVHGISNAMLAGQPLWPEAAARFWRWLMNLAGGGRPIVLIAHNAPFDVSIIRTENARWNLTAPVPIEVIDTFPLFRDLKSAGIIGVESLGLRSIALQLLNFEMPQQHDALGDASALARLCELPNVRSYLNARRLPAWRVPPPAFWNGFNRPPAPANLQPREAVRLLHSACLTVLARRSEIGWPVEEVIGGGGPDARTRLKAAVLDEVCVGGTHLDAARVAPASQITCAPSNEGLSPVYCRAMVPSSSTVSLRASTHTSSKRSPFTPSTRRRQASVPSGAGCLPVEYSRRPPRLVQPR